MEKTCKECNKNFSIPEEDLNFYKKIPVKLKNQNLPIDSPDYCVLCRHKKRLAFRNEMFLYKRKCDFSNKNIISMYSEDKPYKIYDQEIWWSDKWDPFDYGMDFDFSKTFMEQFKELQLKVPRMSLNNISPENSEFCNYALSNKNSYLIFTGDFNEKSLYLRFSDHNYLCADCDYTYYSTECYGCLDCEKCNRCLFSEKCINSSGLYFCYDMIGCHDCIGCTNLRNKQYYIFNKKYSKQEYEKKLKELNLNNYLDLTKFKREVGKFFETQPRKHLEIINCENSIGNYIRDSKNAYMCYNCKGLEDCKHMINCYYAKDCMDWDFVGLQGSSFCHEMVSSALNLVDCHFCMNCWENQNNLYYCDLCLQSKNLFGCIGMRHKQYCILNKQYSKEEYEELILRIVDHMKETREWGQFFSKEISPFGYNESLAYEYFPLTKEQANSQGWKWKDEVGDKKQENLNKKNDLPEDINEAGEDVFDKVFVCDETGKVYKIIKDEYKLLKKLNIALPRISPFQRHKNRMSRRNTWKLWKRKCDKCGIEIKTIYDSNRAEPVYCVECYLREF
jgi:hypothetical protein